MTMTNDSAGRRVALVTGCSSGIGRGLVRPLLERGFHVIASMRRADARRDEFLGEFAPHSDCVTVIELDVTSAADRTRVVEHIRSRHGRLDCLVNNAGYGLFGALERTSEDEIRQQLEVNVVSVILLTQECLPLLRSTGGRVVNLSSVLGRMGLPLTSLYCVSKFAIEGLSEALRLELSTYGVKVCCIEPGGHRTNFSQNIVWGSRQIPDSNVYVQETERYRNEMRVRIDERGVPPVNVVRAIIRVLDQRRMPPRVAVGADSHLASLMKKLLPDRLFMTCLELGTRWTYYRPAAGSTDHRR